LIGITSAIAEAAGDKAPAMLKQIPTPAPTLAYIGGLAASGGSTAAVNDGRTACYCAGHQASRRCRARTCRGGRGPFRSAFSELPATRDAAVATADAIYEVRARRCRRRRFRQQPLWRISMK